MIRLVWPLLQNPVYKVFWHRDWLLPSCLALQFSVHCPYKTLDRVSMPDDIGSCPNGGRIPGICARPTTARRPLRLTGDQCWTKHRLNPTDIAEELTSLSWSPKGANVCSMAAAWKPIPHFSNAPPGVSTSGGFQTDERNHSHRLCTHPNGFLHPSDPLTNQVRTVSSIHPTGHRSKWTERQHPAVPRNFIDGYRLTLQSSRVLKLPLTRSL